MKNKLPFPWQESTSHYAVKRPRIKEKLLENNIFSNDIGTFTQSKTATAAILFQPSYVSAKILHFILQIHIVVFWYVDRQRSHN